MRMWTKSACVVLALSVLLILPAVGMKGYDRAAQANTSIASKSQTTAATLAVVVVSTKNTPTYVVQRGDTLSGIAARFAVPGGWPALYAANLSLLGPDPNIIQPGTVVVLPGVVAPVRYTVAPGDTLSGIAAALAVPGGWLALYAANRQAIGANPNVLQHGTVLVVPAPSRTPPGGLPRLRPPSETSPAARPARPPAPTGTRHAHVALMTQSGAATGMPRWLATLLLAVALLIGVAFLAEPVVVLTRQRRRAATRAAPVTAACASRDLGSAGRAAGERRIVVADYDRLVVTHCRSDDTVYVLRPPGEDPMAVLRVARVVLPEHRYQELADHLGASASWPVSGPGGGEPSRTCWPPPTLPDGGGSVGLQGSPQSLGRGYRSAGSDEDLLRSDSTSAAT